MTPFQSREALEAGRKYLAKGAIPADSLRDVIYRAWERSHIQGANPLTLQAEKLSKLDTQRLLEQQNSLICAARPYMKILSQAAKSDRHAVMLSEKNAIVLDVVGDEQSVNGPERVPDPGSLLSEAVAGSNGLGTPLAENSYVEIVGAEHFIAGFHPFTCQGIPLRNDKHQVIGALSISVRQREVGQRLKDILICASHGVEAEMLFRRLEADVRSVVTTNPEDAQPLDNLYQDIVQAHSAARLRLEMTSRLVAGSKFDYAKQLLQQAEELIHLFRHRAILWRNLASFAETEQVKPICLSDGVQELVDLLATETKIREVEILIQAEEEVWVEADYQIFFKNLFHYFLRAFELVGSGGSVLVKISELQNLALGEITIIPIPALNMVQSKPNPFMLRIPTVRKSYEYQ
ncbi:sigma-54-dependent Fis family transcriptional regulator [Phormidium sp. LEGE 05292]|uniref:GAF domain-containing protein n=1 Tax=[Phormidium] sp. LEGE 05292 TaxID=767427 RepID=UPI0018826B19|nr:GAF domain-containing protein [Phormidium sp. LEGE 05292]MBE9229901.1 sigma-54-dependent Fis family transcriptional regulator [Phormidium sp. LEGE 05292]